MTTGGHHDDGAKGAPAHVDDSKNLCNTNVINKSKSQTHFLMRLPLVGRSELFSSRLAGSESNIPATKKYEASSF